MVENGGNASRAMRDAGYSPATAENPSKLTSSLGFQELMAQMGVTDDKLIHVLNDGLDDEDANVRHKYLETSLKIKGIGRGESNSFTFNFSTPTRKYIDAD